MPNTIIVPIDESGAATRVLPFAVRLADATTSSIALVQAIPDEGLREHAEMALQRVAWHIPTTLPCTMCVRVGSPTRVIVEVAGEVHACLIAMATQHPAEIDRWLNGSIADEVLRVARVPVLIVPPTMTRSWREQGMRILVPLDGSARSEAVLEPVVDLARALQASLLLLRVTHTPQAAQVYLEQVAQRLADLGVHSTLHVAGGDPVEEITRVARQSAVDLIALATHGRTGLTRLAAGSVATGTLQQGQRPVLIVRPSDLSGPDMAEAGPALVSILPPADSASSWRYPPFTQSHSTRNVSGSPCQQKG